MDGEWYVALVDGALPQVERPRDPDLILDVASSDVGTFLVGEGGRTAYVLAHDTPGRSGCDRVCVARWPPMTVPHGGAVGKRDEIRGVVGSITAADGSRLVTYDGQPLYCSSGDTSAGDAKGHGLGGVWHVAKVEDVGPR